MFVLVGCKQPVINNKPEKMVCYASLLGDNEWTIEYLEEKLISTEQNYFIKVNDEEEIDYYYNKEWKFFLEPLEGVNGIKVNWSVAEDKSSMYFNVKMDIQNVDINNILDDSNSDLWDFVNERDACNVEIIRKRFENEGFSCE